MVKEKYDVEIHSPYEVFCNPAPLTIVYTTREFQPGGEAFDQTYKFIGPSISSRFTQENLDIPLIVLPQSADQPIIAEQVAKIGAGIQLQMQSLTANQLREAVDHMLSHSSFKKAVANSRESFRKSGGYHRAVDEIMAERIQD